MAWRPPEPVEHSFPPDDLFTPPVGPRTPPKWILWSMPLLTLVAGGYVGFYEGAPAGARPSLNLRLIREGGRVMARWNPEAAPASVDAALLIENDSGWVRRPISGNALRAGRVEVDAAPPDFRVQLVSGGRVESVRFSDPRAGGRAVVNPGESKSGAAEVAPLIDSIVKQREENRRLQLRLETLRSALSRALGSSSGKAPRRERFEEPVAVHLAPAPRPTTPPGPRFSDGVAVVAEPVPPIAVSLPNRAPPPSDEPAPASGRLVWLGSLQKDSLLVIDGRTASAGELAGQLPGTPVQVRVLPAFPGEDGLVAYGPTAADPPRTLPPGPDTLWRRLTFLADPAKARAVVLVEAPNPESGWRRLAARARGEALTALVIEWEKARAR